MKFFNLRLIDYQSSYYQSLRRLSASFPKSQPKNYIYHNQKMFENLYKGFGHKETSSLLMLDEEDQVVAFRGVIPSLYQLPIKRNKYEILKGNGITGWIIKKDPSLPKGIGLKLNNQAQNKLSVTVASCFGNGLSLQVHKMNQFNIINNLYRYIIPLSEKLFMKAINPNHNPFLVRQWYKKVNMMLKNHKDIKPVFVNAKKLETFWKKVSQYRELFGLYKNKEYWSWRYLECPYNNYIFFGDIDNVGIVIVRIEKIFKFNNSINGSIDNNDSLFSKKVLRIIEILPASEKAWNLEIDSSFNELLISVLKWASDNGCIAADYQFSSLLFDKQMKFTNFKTQSIDYKPAECSLAGLFQPFELEPYPINLAFKISFNNQSDLSFTPLETYFCKTDVAGDYPKYWPKLL